MAAMEPRPPRRPPEGQRGTLPRIVAVEFRPVRLEQPRTYYVGHVRRETRELLEILLQTAAPLPIAAISPVLYIGDAGVEDYEVIGHNQYRFIAYEPRTLPANTAVALGWPGEPAESRVASATRYKPTVA